MKKIIFGLVLLLAIGSSITTNAQEKRIKYWYYPSSNVYYNDATGDYWYYDTPTTTWKTTRTLSSDYTVDDTHRYMVYYNGADVWKDNSRHRMKYKVKKNGRVKMKPKDD